MVTRRTRRAFAASCIVCLVNHRQTGGKGRAEQAAANFSNRNLNGSSTNRKQKKSWQDQSAEPSFETQKVRRATTSGNIVRMRFREESGLPVSALMVF